MAISRQLQTANIYRRRSRATGMKEEQQLQRKKQTEEL